MKRLIILLVTLCVLTGCADLAFQAAGQLVYDGIQAIKTTTPSEETDSSEGYEDQHELFDEE